MRGYRKERLVVQGKTIGVYTNFGSPGKVVAVPISAEDSKSGKINVSLVNLTDVNAVVSRIEFASFAPSVANSLYFQFSIPAPSTSKG